MSDRSASLGLLVGLGLEWVLFGLLGVHGQPAAEHFCRKLGQQYFRLDLLLELPYAFLLLCSEDYSEMLFLLPTVVRIESHSV